MNILNIKTQAMQELKEEYISFLKSDEFQKVCQNIDEKLKELEFLTTRKYDYKISHSQAKEYRTRYNKSNNESLKNLKIQMRDQNIEDCKQAILYEQSRLKPATKKSIHARIKSLLCEQNGRRFRIWADQFNDHDNYDVGYHVGSCKRCGNHIYEYESYCRCIN